MEYKVSFTFNCISKKGLVSQKSGTTTVVTDNTIEHMINDAELLTALAKEMSKVTKKGIISVEINGIKPVKTILDTVKE